ncbi:radical SAM protein [Thermodesulforhabdus norvegica]|uniref:Radical SAM superfamily enzyme, MoaA/NifB/PqqE/SkfB family n=1 Tax=Thermodesulforhabdus norvegica TaxID=39841 RepID=A0A1I4R9Q0_9BACT|nr:radical SAM protein [Thermodesulforhabdus norvegica]SFM48939.1 Radical SAM superfamily enzyme, MoaA/NifB/PqqE/SkfB family [Thermodesulforhabdus norvegica]
MITRKIGLKELLEGSIKFFSMKAGKSFFGLHIEVTRRCNARCVFCDYWKTKGPESLCPDYGHIVKKFNPLHVTITGGEPLLRKDLEAIVRRIVEQNRFVYINCITNGILLNREKALKLWEAGLSQISVSLDFPDSRHDALRNVPGLWNHIKELMKTLPSTGIDNLCFNTVIMRDNLDVLETIAGIAHDHGWKVSFSTYNPFKNKNFDHKLDSQFLNRLEETILRLIYLKSRYRNITNSDYYLLRIVDYVKNGGIPGCLAGLKWAHISPDGMVRRCSEKEILGRWQDLNLKAIPQTGCRECWYACRGEAEAPLDLKRIIELNR